MLKPKCKALWIEDCCVVVDIEDYERVAKYRWRIVTLDKWTYAVRSFNNDTVYMHRFIMNCPRGVYVDHRDREGLNNRKSNLRKCSNSQNQYNVGKKSNSNQKYKNIRLTKSGNYEVRMRTSVGRLSKVVKTEIEAIRLHNEWAKKYHKEFAYLIE